MVFWKIEERLDDPRYLAYLLKGTLLSISKGIKVPGIVFPVGPLNDVETNDI